MASGDVEEIQLRRYDSSQQWGFRMQGGSEQNMPLYIAHVSPKSIAGKAGVRNGDAVLQIDKASTQGWSHSQAKQAINRGGNEVDVVVQRGAINVQDMPAEEGGSARVEMDEGSINPHMNEGSKFRNVKPKSYRMLEAQLGGPAPPSVLGKKKAQPAPPPAAAATGPPAGGAKPSSIFDRKKQDRSDYLQSQGTTIQKAYGQSQ